MKIGALVFLTEQSGNPGAIAREVENLGFESFFVAEHMVVPSSYTTHYPRSRDGKVPVAAARRDRNREGDCVDRSVFEGALDSRRRRGMVSRRGASDGRRFCASVAASARIGR